MKGEKLPKPGQGEIFSEEEGVEVFRPDELYKLLRMLEPGRKKIDPLSATSSGTFANILQKKIPRNGTSAYYFVKII